MKNRTNKILVYTAQIGIMFGIFLLLTVVSFNKSYTILRLPMEAQLSGIVFLGDRSCSGFVPHPGYVITAAHCIQEALYEARPLLQVTFTNGYSASFEVVEYGKLDYRDFALLKGDTKEAIPLEFDSKIPVVGDVCASIGYGGYAQSQMISPCQVALNIGLVSGYLPLFADIIPGDSGSAVISIETQKVIGISVRSRSPIPVALATPIRYAREALLKDLAKSQEEESAK